MPQGNRAIQEEKSTGKRATSVEDGNSTDGKGKAGSMIAALSTKELAKLELGPMRYGKSDAGRRNSSAEDRKPAGCKDKDPARDMAKGTIAALSTTKGSTRRDKPPKDKEPTRLEDRKCVDDAGQRRMDSPGMKLEKRTLFASQMEEASESLRYPESKKSTSEDSATQERTERSDIIAEPVRDTTE